MEYDFLESFQRKISAAAEHLLRQSWTGCAKRKFVSHLFVQWVIFDTSLRLSRPFLDRWNVMIYANTKHDSGTNSSVLNFASQMLNDPRLEKRDPGNEARNHTIHSAIHDVSYQFWYLTRSDKMVVVGAAILPHGAMVFDGDPNSVSPACRERNSSMPANLIGNCSKLYNSCERVGDHVAKMDPDFVLLVTPHGIALSSGSYGVYMANAARGNALWNDCFQDIELSIPLDTEISEKLLGFVQQKGFKADGIITFSLAEAPLRWGEVIPLWFVNKKVDSDKVKYVIVTFARIYDEEGFNAGAMGRALHEFAASLQQRVAVVISGDLAHTHTTDYSIPLYLPDPRWDLKPAGIAEEFDRTCELWARGIPYSEVTKVGSASFEETHPWVASQCAPWLQKVIGDDPVAKSCGRKGFQILHGILEKQIDDGGSVTSHFFTRCAPTYYGMMTAVFEVN